jgi:hypothetical protein
MEEHIHIAHGGVPLHCLTSDDGSAICLRCQHLQPGGQPDYYGFCRRGRVLIYESYSQCDRFEEAPIGQRTLL